MSSKSAGRGRPDLVAGPIASTLLAFALPGLGANILQSLNGSINAIWVGQLLGEVALAATANANLIMFLLFASVFGLAMAASMLIGQSAGRRDLDEVRRIVGSACAIFLVAGILLALLGFFLTPHILSLLGTPHEAYPLALAYLQIIFLAMPPLFLMVLLTLALRSSGDALTPLWFMAVSVAIDITLNPLLISGVGPFPAMGIAGSAMATLIANYATLLALVIYVYGRDLPIRLRGAEWRYLQPQARFMPTIVGRGLMVGLQMLVMALSSLAVIGLVNRSGAMVVAAYGAVNQIWTYVQMPSMAIAGAVTAMAAQNIGAGRWDRLSAIARSGVLITLAISGAMTLAVVAFDHRVLMLFLETDSPAIDVGEHINSIAIWSWLVLGFGMVPGSIMRANGAVLAPLVILIISVLPIRLGLAYAFEPRFGPDAIWWSMIVGSIASCLMTLGYYRWGRWRETRLLQPAHPPSKPEEMSATAG